MSGSPAHTGGRQIDPPVLTAVGRVIQRGLLVCLKKVYCTHRMFKGDQVMTNIHERAFDCALRDRQINKETLQHLIKTISAEYADKKKRGVYDIDFEIIVSDALTDINVGLFGYEAYKHAIGVYYSEKRRRPKPPKYKMHVIRVDKSAARVQVAPEVCIDFKTHSTLGPLVTEQVYYKCHVLEVDVAFDTGDEALIKRAADVARKAINVERRKPKRKRAA